MPLEASLLPRMIVGIAMVIGIIVAGLVFVVGGSLMGWLAGYVIDAVRHGKAEAPDLAAQHK